jgi:polyphosphate glucokinase
MKILVVDVGGTNVKILATGKRVHRKFSSGQVLTAAWMVSKVKELAGDWRYDAVSIGYPGVVRRGKIVEEPVNLGPGWRGFNFRKAFGRPVKILNDAAMQALGSYRKGSMLFLGFGTGLGAALIADGVIVPLEIAHLPYKKLTIEDYVGARALDKNGKKKWRKHSLTVIDDIMKAFEPEDVVIGGGNAKKLGGLPRRCRLGSNANAFRGGFRLWK